MKHHEDRMSKRDAGHIGKCREIVKEITDFGVNEFMVLQIINLLALQLENRDALIEICDTTKKYLSSDNETQDLIL
tara:strand:- start:295 stop:522 length:228 start_codon:yes stop_codon:yes gene_type:complete